MGKETKLGIIVVGVLLGAFLGLLIKRFVLTPHLPAVEPRPSQLAHEPKPIPGADQPTVVTAQRDVSDPAHGTADDPWGGNSTERSVDVPHGSFLPADGPPVNPRYEQPAVNPRYEEPPVNPRYAEPAANDPATEQPQPTPAVDETAEPGPVDPFHARFMREGAAGEPPSGTPAAVPNEKETAPLPKANQVAPQQIEVTPDAAEALDARKAPARTVRNPLRQLSAEMPLEEGADGGDVVPPENLYPNLDPPAGTSDDSNEDALGLEPAAAPQGLEDPYADEQQLDEQADDPLDVGAAPAGNPFGSGMPEPETAGALPAEPEMPAPRPAPQRYQTPADYGQINAAQMPRSMPPQAALPADGRYTVQPNDSLWTISEKVYGDGRYYKAIGEHNRQKLPQPDRLTVGTVLDVPAVSVLEQNYPSMCPRKRRSAVVRSRTVPAAAEQPLSASSDVYVVVEGDTLMDIARYELGKASRWGEIYELNRDQLGEDFDFLQPGLELRLPPKTPAGTISRQPAGRYQR